MSSSAAPNMLEFETKLYRRAVSGKFVQFGTSFDSAPSVESMRAKLQRIFSEKTLFPNGSDNYLFVTREVVKKPAVCDIDFWKGNHP